MNTEFMRRLNQYPLDTPTALAMMTKLKEFLQHHGLYARVMMNIDAWKISLHSGSKYIIGFYFDFEHQVFVPQFDIQACWAFERQNHLSFDLAASLTVMCHQAYHGSQVATQEAILQLNEVKSAEQRVTH